MWTTRPCGTCKRNKPGLWFSPSFNWNRHRFVQPCLAKPKNELLISSYEIKMSDITKSNPIRPRTCPIESMRSHFASSKPQISRFETSLAVQDQPGKSWNPWSEHPAHCNMERGGLEEYGRQSDKHHLHRPFQAIRRYTHTHTLAHILIWLHTFFLRCNCMHACPLFLTSRKQLDWGWLGP